MSHLTLTVFAKRSITTKKKEQIPQVSTSVTSKTFKFKKSKNKEKDKKFTNNFSLALTLFPAEYLCSLFVNSQDQQLSKKVCRKKLKILLEKAKVHLMHTA